MSRPTIPAEIRRAVLVESGHRCAIPRCGQTEIDVHHIIPWESCQAHEYSNLIALCPICHRRAHNGDIDRKSLFIYKENLTKEFEKNDAGTFEAQIIEIKRRIKNTCTVPPGYTFQFDFPDFQAAHERIVSRNIEAWGYELLVELDELQKSYILFDSPEIGHPQSVVTGAYDIIRRDESIISIRYNIDRYYTGNAHGGRTTRVLNYCLRPFFPLTLERLLGKKNSICELANFIRGKLSQTDNYDAEWLARGTEAQIQNFSLFNIDNYGISFTFSEYQIDCFAAGEQYLWVALEEIEKFLDPDTIDLIKVNS